MTIKIIFLLLMMIIGCINLTKSQGQQSDNNADGLLTRNKRAHQTPPLIHAADPYEQSKFRANPANNGQTTHQNSPNRQSNQGNSGSQTANYPIPSVPVTTFDSQTSTPPPLWSSVAVPSTRPPPPPPTATPIGYTSEFPWMVVIFEKTSTANYNYLCSGTIISPSFVLTTADCVYNYQPNQLKLRAGSFSTHNVLFASQESDVTQITLQHNYNNQFNHNIALITIFSPYDFKTTTNINNIRIYQTLDRENLYQNCFVTSWPTNIHNNKLYYLHNSDSVKHKITLVNIIECVTKIRNVRPDLPLADSILCAGNQNLDENFYDINGGSPLLCQLNDEPNKGHVLVGILLQNNATLPYVFTSIVKELEWLSSSVISTKANRHSAQNK